MACRWSIRSSGRSCGPERRVVHGVYPPRCEVYLPYAYLSVLADKDGLQADFQPLKVLDGNWLTADEEI
jgi:hypothetical protein